ncbi:hypothetical protein EDC04DRAFT_446780 [Pisolithus marmoratus]|nr:hypothetical protein EDC04DRAFT_446780 [Pisolithus marmoratus]
MQSDPSYSTQLFDTHAVLDCSPPLFPGDVACAEQQQWCDPSHTLYDATPRRCPDGQDVLRQNLPLTQGSFPIGDQFLSYPVFGYGCPMIFSEYDRHFQNGLMRASVPAPALGMYGTRDYPPRALYFTNDVENAEASMVHTFDQTCPACNVQDVRGDDPVTPCQTSLVEENGRSSIMGLTSEGTISGAKVPSSRLPPHDNPYPPINDTVQTGVSIWTTEYGHANPINPEALGGSRHCRDVQAFHDTDEQQLPLSYMSPTSRHVLTGCDETAASPPVVPNVANETAMNEGMKPLPLDYTGPQPGGADDYEWMCGNYHVSSKVAPLSHSNEPRHQQSYSSHRSHQHEIGNLSMRGGSPEVDYSHTGTLVNAPGACVLRNLTAPKPPKPCGWRDSGDRICGILVTYDNLADHLAEIHSIKDLSSDVEIECRWCLPGKMVKRRNILRHFREKHLGYPRRKKRVVPQVSPTTYSRDDLDVRTPVEPQTFMLSHLPEASFPTRARSPAFR